MANSKAVVWFFLVTLCAPLFSSSAQQSSAPLPETLPTALREWVSFVESRDPSFRCAVDNGAGRVCQWPTVLELQMGAQEGIFSLSVQLDSAGETELPGGTLSSGERLFPTGLTASSMTGGEVPLRLAETASGRPALYLSPGRYLIRGKFLYQTIPQLLPIPANTGLTRLTINGLLESAPVVSQSGELQIAPAPKEGAEEDRLSVEISRKLTDSVPTELETVLEFRISGRSREISIGEILPSGFIPVGTSGSLPLRFDEAGKLSLQGYPGIHRVTITAVRSSELRSVTVPTTLAEYEQWAFQPNEELRTVELSGGAGVDPSRTTVPAHWRSLNLILLKGGEDLKISEIRRGRVGTTPDSLALNRDLFLDLDGHGFTVRDRLTGSLNESLRLEMAPPTVLSSVELGGRLQLITVNPENKNRGVEVRDREVSLTGISRVESRAIPAVSWNHDVTSLASTLHLPPGYELFHASGVDTAYGSFISGWTLLDLFLVLLITASCKHLFGVRGAVIAALAVILTHNRLDNGPILWINLIVVAGLLRVLPAGGFRNFMELYRKGALLVLALLLVGFVIDETKNALFPQLATTYSNARSLGGYLEEKSFQSSQNEAISVDSMEALEAEGGAASDMAAPVPRAQRMTLGKVNAPPQSLQQIDPNAVVQTGRGFPNWNFRQYRLHWSGPVSKDHQMRLYLLSPFLLRVLTFLRIGALLLLSSLFLGVQMRKLVPVSLIILFSITTLSSPASAQSIPGEELLSELQERLRAGRCTERCVSTPELTFELKDSELQVTAVVSSHGAGAWPIPGPVSEFYPNEVSLGNDSSPALRRGQEGAVYVRVPDGKSVVRVRGTVQRAGSVALQLFSDVGRVSFSSRDWSADGISPTGGVKGTIQLSRREVTEKKIESGEENLREFFIVRRELVLGLPWSVQTTVRRFGPARNSTSLSVLPLTEERIVDGGVTSKDGKVEVEFPRGVTQVSFQSRLEEQDLLSLKASDGAVYSEEWIVSCSSIFRCEQRSGIPVQSLFQGNTQSFQYTPWPNEELTLSVVKPLGAEGESSSLQSSQVTFLPGERVSELRGTLTFKNSGALQQRLKFPEKSELSQLTLNGRELPNRMVGEELQVALPPGENVLNFTLRSPTERSLWTVTPKTVIFREGMNATIEVTPEAGRWVLWTSGPSWGPAVLFWCKLLLILLGAALLGRVMALPVRTSDWVLLGLGLSATSSWGIVIPVLWFFALWSRGEYPLAARWRFNFLQLGLVVLTYYTVTYLYSGVYAGLILNPDSGIVGNGSYNGQLRWYQDVYSDALPEVGYLSVPIWVWRVFMLCWSLWISVRVIRWAKWGWERFSVNGLWMKKIRGEE